MPIYPIKAPDGRIFRLEGDSEPTQDEIEAAYAQLPSLDTGLPSKAERQSVIQSFQKSTPQRLQDLALLGPNALLGLGKMGIGAAKEFQGALNAGLDKAVAGEGVMAAEKAFLGPLAQSAVEAGPRIGFDLLNTGRQAIPAAGQAILQNVVQNPLSAGSPLTMLSDLIRNALTPNKTPSEAEIQNELAKRQENQAFELIRQEGVAPAIPFVEGGKFGEPLNNLTDLLGMAADPELAMAVAPAGLLKVAPKLLTNIPGGKANLLANAYEAGGRLPTGFRQTARDLMTKFINPLTADDEARLVKSADDRTLFDAVQEVSQVAGVPVDAKDFAPKVRIAKEARGTQLDEFLVENGSGELNTDRVKSAMIEDINTHPKLNDPKIPKETRDAQKARLIAQVDESFPDRWTANDAFEEQKRLNRVQQADIAKAQVSRENLLTNNAAKSMEDAKRRAISVLLDDYQKGITGIDDNAFRVYGQLSELEASADAAYNSAVTQRSRRSSGRSTPIRPQSAIAGKAGIAAEVSKPVVGRIAADELKDLDSATKLLFQRIPQALPPQTLNEVMRGELLGRSQITDTNLQNIVDKGYQERLLAEGATPEDLNAYLNEEEALRVAQEAAPEGLEALSTDLNNIIRNSQVATPAQLSNYLTGEANLTKAERVAKAKEFAKKLEEDILKAIRANP